jgi:hypothetical protein
MISGGSPMPRSIGKEFFITFLCIVLGIEKVLDVPKHHPKGFLSIDMS